MTEEMEHRVITTELRVDPDKRKVFGLANVFGNQDSYGTIFDRGAFKKTIRAKFRAGKIKFLFNHDPWAILGKLTKLRETDEGLEFEGQVGHTSMGDDILTHIQDGALTDNSIGFRRVKTREVDEDDATEDDLEGLHFVQVELFDVSPVTFGANDLAIIGGVRSQFGEVTAIPTLDEIAEAVIDRFRLVVPDLDNILDRIEGLGKEGIDIQMRFVREGSEDDDAQREEARKREEEGRKDGQVDDPSHTRDGDSKNRENKNRDSGRTKLRRAQLAIREREAAIE